ncbi:beta-1,4-N-acetylgalactosaminyltransferase 3 [Stegastes partitus]|uniref:Beta-1,4-N-acetylgalactosaminyltransferase n=1 Tax=Stegastes partitus TaxID=144197 RepID=A0A3B4Z895_9TELE|nr:PREDICTED: beta-1,4-N-acetylgalactosaminyltransferase 3 [Stegastes partitus]
MILTFFPVKKLRRNGRYVLLGAILLVGAVAVYHEMVAAKAWSSDMGMGPDAAGSSWRRSVLDERVRQDHRPGAVEDSAAWISSYTPQTWKPEYKGRANLHVFEDWCGSSTADLRKNLHYPLYPHSRTTVQKLAVSPLWTNYGLRIFGYLHPYTDGEFVFALSSDDNSDLWLSTDDSPLNLQLLSWVGKTGTEWTAPGEFEKYASQTSRPVRLSAQRRYFFEVIHKQNDRGADHVEVAWQLLDQDSRFMVIESQHISLYVDESAFLMGDVGHIPQTAASHERTPTINSAAADILNEDPRDTFYQVPFINSKFLQGVLPDCSYNPSYTIKDYPLLRYQGLHFVHMSYIYPNDYTRLTHMETEKSCFYPENPYYMKMFGFSAYMRLDRPDVQEGGATGRDFGNQGRKSVLEEEYDNEPYEQEKEFKLDEISNALFSDNGDDYDDYALKRRRKLFSLASQETNDTLENSSVTRLQTEKMQKRQTQDNVSQPEAEKTTVPPQPVPSQASKHPRQQNLMRLKQKKKSALRPKQKKPQTTVKNKQLKAKQRPVAPLETLKDSQHLNQEQDASLPEKPTVAEQRKFVTREKEKEAAISRHFVTWKRDIKRPLAVSNQNDADARKSLRDKEIEMNMPLQQDLENSIPGAEWGARGKMGKKLPDVEGEGGRVGEEDEVHNRVESQRSTRQSEGVNLWGPGEEFDVADDEDSTPAPVFDTQVNWNQTFKVNHMDLHAQRSDGIDLQCNISGNLLLHSSDALPIVKTFMEHLNEKHHGQFTLVRVVNVVKRADGIQGSRYLLELELKDAGGRLRRLSHYIYALIRRSRRSKDFSFQQPKPQLVLCNPVGFQWNPVATVHFIVPVKNQARWVQYLISEMERIFRETGDVNFNLIITDYNSTDMDVRKALQKSSLPRYQYVKLGGNFERSAGLQAGIDLINDDHSIVFLCDLHIHFPPSIVDTIRKHCVEGYMAFAPIVQRLDCGTTPLEAKGYWEVNGFGLLGIYKSDLVTVGGMNTKEFKDRWGGEDWELLDRILQAGLEVDRIYLRNFSHNYHSKRGMWNRRMSTGHR